MLPVYFGKKLDPTTAGCVFTVESTQGHKEQWTALSTGSRWGQIWPLQGQVLQDIWVPEADEELTRLAGANERKVTAPLLDALKYGVHRKKPVTNDPLCNCLSAEDWKSVSGRRVPVVVAPHLSPLKARDILCERGLDGDRTSVSSSQIPLMVADTRNGVPWNRRQPHLITFVPVASGKPKDVSSVYAAIEETNQKRIDDGGSGRNKVPYVTMGDPRLMATRGPLYTFTSLTKHPVAQGIRRGHEFLYEKWRREHS